VDYAIGEEPVMAEEKTPDDEETFWDEAFFEAKPQEPERILEDHEAQWVSVEEMKKKRIPDGSYFPKGFFWNYNDEDSESFNQNRYNDYLEAMQEPVLFRENISLAFRFLWLRSFDPPVAIRLIKSKQNSFHMVVKVTNAEDDRESGEIVIDQDSELTAEQCQPLFDKINSCHFWNRLRDKEYGQDMPYELTADGSNWLVEGMEDGKYHAVSRNNDETPCINEIGRIFLKLSGLKIREEKIY